MAATPRRLVIGLCLFTALALPGALTRADTLLVEGVSEARPTAAERPGRGSRMADVEARFGAPDRRSAAVGRPPITRWDYADFIVYFEYDHVVHTVRR
jgi:hypothetical protein